MRREFFSKPGTGRRQAVQCGECIAKHGLAVEATNRLVERPKRLRKISIELKELSKEALRDLASRQPQAVQGAEQRQQVKSGGFQARTELGGDFLPRARGHAPRIAHRRTEIKIRWGAELVDKRKRS